MEMPAGVDPLPQAFVKEMIEKYGISPNDVQMMWAVYVTQRRDGQYLTDDHPAKWSGDLTPQDFEKRMLSGSSGSTGGFGAKLKESKGDKKIEAQNKEAVAQWRAWFDRRLPEQIKNEQEALSQAAKTDASAAAAPAAPVDPNFPVLPLATIECTPIPGTPAGSGASPVTLPRFPSEAQLQGMSDAEVKTLWQHVLSELPEPKPPTFEAFMKGVEEYIKGCCKNDPGVAIDDLNRMFGKLGADPVLLGLAMEMNKRSMTAFANDVFKVQAHAQECDARYPDSYNTWDKIKAIGVALVTPVPGSVVLAGAAIARDIIKGVVHEFGKAYPGMDYVVNGMGSFTINGWNVPDDADLSPVKTDWINSRSYGKPGSVPAHALKYPVEYRSQMDRLNELSAKATSPKDQKTEPGAQPSAGPKVGPVGQKYADIQTAWTANAAEQTKFEAAWQVYEQEDAQYRENFSNGMSYASDVARDGSQRMQGKVTTGSGESMQVMIEEMQGKLDSLSEMTELDQMRLQKIMDARSKFFEMMSNMMKKRSDTASSLTKNMA
jgi:hypothetical protein